MMMTMIGMIISITMSIYQLLRFNYPTTTVNRDLFLLHSIPQKQQQQHQQVYLRTRTKHDGGNDDNDSTDDMRQQLPHWMEDYFAWHTQQLNQLNETNWHTQKYLILRCLSTDTKCGGLSDRLQSIPLMIYKAYQTKRILFIKWERPFPLETFLVPPSTIQSPSSMASIPSSSISKSPPLKPPPTQTILDWRIPSFLDDKLPFQIQPTILTLLEMVNVQPTDTRVVLDTYLFRQQGKFIKWYNYLLQQHQQQNQQQSSSNGGRSHSTKNNKYKEEEPSIESIYHMIWDRIFQPTPSVQTLIDRSMNQLNLTKNKYVAVHIRALYDHQHHQVKEEEEENQEGGTTTVTRVLQDEYENAINCGSQLRSSSNSSSTTAATTTASSSSSINSNNDPIFVASDSNDVIKGAFEYGRQNHIPVVSNQNTAFEQQDQKQHVPHLLLHLDRGTSFLEAGKDTMTQMYQPSDYYSTFVDLYLLKNARCIAYGRGGYGKWAQLLQQQQLGQSQTHTGANAQGYHPSCSIDYLKNTCPPRLY